MCETNQWRQKNLRHSPATSHSNIISNTLIHTPPETGSQHNNRTPPAPPLATLPTTSAIERCHQHPTTTPSARPQATPSATPSGHIRDQIPPVTPTQTPLTTLPNHLRDQALLPTPHTTTSATPLVTSPPPSQQPEKHRYHLPLDLK